MKLEWYHLGLKLFEIALLAVFVVGWNVNAHAAPREKTETENAQNAQKNLPSSLSREARAAKSLNAFALDLYRELANTKNSNIFFSPQSVSTAFAMLFPAAEGATEREFRQVFHYDDESAADMGALQGILNATPPTAGTLDAASSIWPA